jgi:hypothetical protein
MSQPYARSPRVDVSRVGERSVLYHRENREALVLNASGSWLWDQLSTPRSGEELAAALQSRYKLSPEQAAQDVERFLDDLRQHDALARS